MAKSEMQAFGVGSRIGHNSDKFYQRNVYTPMQQPSTAADNVVPTDSLNTIFAHSSENMSELPNNSVHLMITSPPYNVGKEYDEDLTLDSYRTMLGRVWKETHRVLVDGGRACINVANIGRKPYIPLHAFIASDMLNLGYLMRGEIIWNKAASAGSSCAWGSWRSASNPVLRDVHEYILIFCKTTFKRNGDESTIGRNEFLDWTKSIWTFPAESAKKVGHPAPFPLELPARLIDLYSFKGDVILDPFIGSGTTAVAAKGLQRCWVGYETSQDYVNTASDRLKQETLL
ncbi:MAG: site-specific DNA-methyltransferase [Candidatus Poribacteria bacterium]|nr:site-specific DNA-methyltransferase [Candidatus Poribacteria bacterium]